MGYISTAERLGFEIGTKKAKVIIAQRLLMEGIEIAFITKVTELTADEVKELKEKLGQEIM